jgi:hypothetical protein
MDDGDRHLACVRRTGLDWRHDIEAKVAFFDRDNINGLIASAGIRGDMGLLSVDIGGNDDWVLEGD